MLSQGKSVVRSLADRHGPFVSFPGIPDCNFSDANNGYIIPIPIFGIPSGNRIPYHFSAGQGNEVTFDPYFRSITSGGPLSVGHFR